MQHAPGLFKADLTLKSALGTVMNENLPRLTPRQREIFKATPFGSFLEMAAPNGDPLVMHMMMLHEVRDHEVMQQGRFKFEVDGIELSYGETEFCLITGFRFGPYEDILKQIKTGSRSALRARLFPNRSDVGVRLIDIEEFIMTPDFYDANDGDAVMLKRILLLLKGFMGRGKTSCIPPVVYRLADDISSWNMYE